MLTDSCLYVRQLSYTYSAIKALKAWPAASLPINQKEKLEPGSKDDPETPASESESDSDFADTSNGKRGKKQRPGPSKRSRTKVSNTAPWSIPPNVRKYFSLESAVIDL
jgi:hypothetical protein